MAIYLNEFSVDELKIMQDLVNKELEHTYEMRKKFGHNNMNDYYTSRINRLTITKVKIDDYLVNNERHDRVQEMIDKKFGKKD
jgi:hypothetical protein